jgi:hypothetical protein
MAAGAITVVAGVVGSFFVTPEARTAVWIGAGVAFGVQMVLFVVLFVLVFSSRPMLAHGLGMLGRFLAIVAIALLGLPWSEQPAAPLLLTVVAVFFLTTVLEPLILFSRTRVN